MLNPTVEERVEALLKQLSLFEKISLLSGKDSWNTFPIDRLGLPALTMTDGPHGVRTNHPDAGRPVSSPTTAFPTGVSLGSTWNPDLVERVGQALAEETLAAGCDILLGPCVNIVRTPLAGRNFESYSEDPYLAGRIGAAYVRGLQSKGVGASLKHYALNNQEIERGRGSSEADERTMREIYLPHFEAVVKETQPWTVMCSYNRINGVYASQHNHLLNEILKEEWGFEGAVISDWGANHTIFESVMGGLDIEMPGPAKYYGPLLLEAVNNWQIEEDVIDRAARRVLRMLVRSGRMDAPRPVGSMNTAAHQALARETAQEAVTLLKNRDNLLPIRPRAVKTIAVIGPAADELAISGGGSAYVEPPYRTGPLGSLQQKIGDQVEIRYEQGSDNFSQLPNLKASFCQPAKGTGLGLWGEYFNNTDLSGCPAAERIDHRIDYWWFSSGTIGGLKDYFSIRWTGTLKVPASERYTFRITHSAQVRLWLDGKLLIDSSGEIGPGNTKILSPEAGVDLEKDKAYDLKVELVQNGPADMTHIRLAFAATPQQDDRIQRAAALAREADLALVFVGDTEGFETEGWDRPDLKLPARQDELIRAVAQANPNTVVILNTGAPIEMPWIDEVAGLLQCYYPGLEGGQAVAAVLSGEVNPSGKLTVTYSKRLEDTPSFPNLSYPGAREVHYGEGIFVGYRYYDHAQVEPLFPFGFGLSYTQFEYRNLQVPAEIRPGESFEVSFEVTNTGECQGKEVVQLYVSDSQSSVVRPPKELKGFAKIDLAPGKTQTVRLTLDPRALSFYDILHQQWKAELGEFSILVGASARDIRVQAVVRLLE
jgi:beta-glucosidase